MGISCEEIFHFYLLIDFEINSTWERLIESYLLLPTEHVWISLFLGYHNFFFFLYIIAFFFTSFIFHGHGKIYIPTRFYTPKTIFFAIIHEILQNIKSKYRYIIFLVGRTLELHRASSLAPKRSGFRFPSQRKLSQQNYKKLKNYTTSQYLYSFHFYRTRHYHIDRQE